jgi:drug/metabolite transporter (DMT)-like permease
LKESYKKNHFHGYLFALIATAIWSGNFIVARNLSDTIPPISLAFWRWVIAFMALSPFALTRFIKDWHLLKKHFLYLMITSVFGVTIFNTLIYIAGQTTTAINLSLISITFPIFIIIISRFLYKEKITFEKIVGIILVAIGVVLIITNGSPTLLFQLTFFKGDIWMLLAAIIFAIYSILLKHKPKEINVLTFQYATFTFGLIMLFPFYLIELSVAKPAIYNSTSIISIIYVGIGASLIAFILWNKAILIIGPVRSGMAYYTLPVFSSLLAFFILKENLSTNHFYSAFLIISGIILSNFKTNIQRIRL